MAVEYSTFVPRGRSFVDLRGMRYGQLVAQRPVFRADKTSSVYWVCLCDCGKTATVSRHCLRSGHTTSCGCAHVERARRMNLTHGLSGTPTHRAWKAMKTRCLNPRSAAYQNYGGRGIGICAPWMDYVNFLSDMGEKPDGLTLDRIDNNGNYEPSNCRWATRLEQANNARRNRHVTLNGQRVTVAQASRITGISDKTISMRLRRGWSDEAATRRRDGA